MEERIVESFIHIIEGLLATIITLSLGDLWKELKKNSRASILSI